MLDSRQMRAGILLGGKTREQCPENPGYRISNNPDGVYGADEHARLHRLDFRDEGYQRATVIARKDEGESLYAMEEVVVAVSGLDSQCVARFENGNGGELDYLQGIIAHTAADNQGSPHDTGTLAAQGRAQSCLRSISFGCNTKIWLASPLRDVEEVCQIIKNLLGRCVDYDPVASYFERAGHRKS